jgi:hypothetical protein
MGLKGDCICSHLWAQSIGTKYIIQKVGNIYESVSMGELGYPRGIQWELRHNREHFGYSIPLVRLHTWLVFGHVMPHSHGGG